LNETLRKFDENYSKRFNDLEAKDFELSKKHEDLTNQLSQLRDYHSETEKSLKNHIKDYTNKLKELVLSKDLD